MFMFLQINKDTEDEATGLFSMAPTVFSKGPVSLTAIQTTVVPAPAVLNSLQMPGDNCVKDCC